MSRKNLDEWLWQISEELQRISREVNSSSPQLARQIGWAPRVDILESKENVIIVVEIAGVSEEDIRLNVNPEQRTLELKGVRRHFHDQGNTRGAHQIEIFYGEFARTIELPAADYEWSHLTACYQNGFLTIDIPTTKSTSNVVVRRTIRVKRV
jgi:HSP20 family protein